MTEFVINPVSELTIPVSAGEVRHASAWLEASCLERGVPPDEINRLDLCLNEALANVIEHGGASTRTCPIHLQLMVHQDQLHRVAAITISDSGIPFNPLSPPEKSRPMTLAEAVPGGLGRMMICHFSDAQDYRYDKGNNQLTFSVRWNRGVQQ